MWGIRLFGAANADAIYSCKPWDVYKAPRGTEEIYVIEDYVTAFSVFKAVSLTSAGTVIAVTPPPGGSISITDIIISAEKGSAGNTVVLQFTDGTVTENFTTIAVGTQPRTLTIPIKGRMQGWRDARFEMITSGNGDAFLTLGYMRLPNALVHSEWNDLR